MRVSGRPCGGEGGGGDATSTLETMMRGEQDSKGHEILNDLSRAQARSMSYATEVVCPPSMRLPM